MRLLITLLMCSALSAGCVRRSCEEVTADRQALLEEHQACTVDSDCAVYNAEALLGSATDSCGVIALRAEASASYAEQESALAEEAEDSCDEGTSSMEESLGEGLGNAIGCAVSSALISSDPNDYRAQCAEGTCTASLVVR